MGRAQTLVGLLIGFILMVGVGYLSGYWWDARPQPIPGWCCVRSGEACQQKGSLGACQGEGGTVFDVSKSVCDIVCSTPAQ